MNTIQFPVKQHHHHHHAGRGHAKTTIRQLDSALSLLERRHVHPEHATVVRQARQALKSVERLLDETSPSISEQLDTPVTGTDAPLTARLDDEPSLLAEHILCNVRQRVLAQGFPQPETLRIARLHQGASLMGDLPNGRDIEIVLRQTSQWHDPDRIEGEWRMEGGAFDTNCFLIRLDESLGSSLPKDIQARILRHLIHFKDACCCTVQHFSTGKRA